MAIKTGKHGFTLIEIMIVIAIIGLLAAIAIPNFMKSWKMSQTNVCISNLKELQGAAQIWAIDTGQASNAVATKAVLEPTYIAKWPQETIDNVKKDYDEFVVDEDPVCKAGNPEHTI